jgi:hypothetical protein
MSVIDLVKLLQAAGILDLANVVIALAVAVLAGVQLYQLRVERHRRLKTALAALWVEYWRVETTNIQWAKEDLAALARDGLLDPQQVMPADASSAAQLLGELGMQAARFGGTAFASASLASQHARLLVKAADRRRNYLDSHPDPEQQREFEATWTTAAEKAQTTIRSLARRSASEFEDALLSTPKWLQKETLNLEGLQSDFAKYLREKTGSE